MDLFAEPLNLEEYPVYLLTFAISITGIILGFTIHKILQLPKKIKLYIKLGIPLTIIILLLGSYVLFDIAGLSNLLIILIKTGFFLLLSAIPTALIFGVIRKQKTTIIASSISGLFFFFFSRVLFQKFIFAGNEIFQLTLFIILFLVFLELITSNLNFNKMLEKIRYDTLNTNLISQRFNSVFNRYLIIFSLIFFFSLFITWLVLMFKDIILMSPVTIINIDLTSIYGLLFFVIIIIIGAILFWFSIPREKFKL